MPTTPNVESELKRIVIVIRVEAREKTKKFDTS